MEDTCQFNEDFIMNYKGQSDEEYFLKVDVQYPENYMNFIMIFHFYQREQKLKKLKSLLLIYKIKLNMSFT